MKNLLKYFLISFGIHSFIIIFIFLFEKEFSKPKTDILEVEILSNNGKINKVLTKTEENEIRYKTFIKHSELLEYKDNTHNLTLNKKFNTKNLEVQQKFSKDFNVFINNQNQEIGKTVNSTNSIKKVFSKATYKLGSKKNPHPPYPMIARKEGWQGKLILNVFVNKNGKVKNVELLKSSGYKILDNVSLQTIKTWSFKPARLGKSYVEDNIKIPLRFVLE